MAIYEPGSRFLVDTEPANILILDLPASRTVRSTCFLDVCLSHSVYDSFVTAPQWTKTLLQVRTEKVPGADLACRTSDPEVQGQGSAKFFCKGLESIVGFTGRLVSVSTLPLHPCNAQEQPCAICKRMGVAVTIKLYLQKQVEGQIWPFGSSSLTEK